MRFTCRCSYLQIYNEQVLDLLQPDSRSMPPRMVTTKGRARMEGLHEEVALNGAEPHRSPGDAQQWCSRCEACSVAATAGCVHLHSPAPRPCEPRRLTLCCHAVQWRRL